MFKFLWQLFKYGVIGVLSTLVQTGVFYTLACSCLKCLKTDDVAVRFLGLTPAIGIDDTTRSLYFAAATAIGFVLANIFCWVLNRKFVFTPGKYRWYVEFALFFSAAATATVIAISLSSLLIGYLGLMTSLAVIIEVVTSFIINFIVRKFFIFKG